MNRRAMIGAGVLLLLLVPAIALAQDATPTPNGSEDQPIPLKHSGVIDGKWKVRVVKVYKDAYQLDPNAKWFTDWLDQYPAPAGQQYLSLQLNITNVGKEAAEPYTSLSFDLISETKFRYGGTAYCGNVPGGLDFMAQLDAGDSIKANFCWLVQDRHIPTLRLRVEPAFSFNDQGAVWFAIRPDKGTPQPVS